MCKYIAVRKKKTSWQARHASHIHDSAGYELEGNWSEITQSLALDQYLQYHVKEFCDTLAAADAYIQELRAENVQLKTQFAESDI
jgi:hypothetical protein